MQSRKQTKILLDNASPEKVFAGGSRRSPFSPARKTLSFSKGNGHTIAACTRETAYIN